MQLPSPQVQALAAQEGQGPRAQRTSRREAGKLSLSIYSCYSFYFKRCTHHISYSEHLQCSLAAAETYFLSISHETLDKGGATEQGGHQEGVGSWSGRASQHRSRILAGGNVC